MKIHTKASVIGALSAAIVVGTVAIAGNITLPNTFTAGTPIRSAEVNANFQAVKAGSDDNQAQITALQARVVALEGRAAPPFIKTVETANAQALPAPGTVLSLETLTMTVPSAGFVHLVATGGCGLPTSGTSGLWQTDIYFAPNTTTYASQVAPTDRAELMINGVTTTNWWSWSVTKTVPVTAGANTFYLNAHTTGATSSAAGYVCFARLTGLFSTAQLP